MAEEKRVGSLADLWKLIPGGEAPEEGPAAPAAGGTDPLRGLVSLRVRLETKGRKGSGMTVVTGFHHTREDLAALARELKTLCGAGGTVKDDRIEIQGDHRAVIVDALQKKGFSVKQI